MEETRKIQELDEMRMDLLGIQANYSEEKRRMEEAVSRCESKPVWRGGGPGRFLQRRIISAFVW